MTRASACAAMLLGIAAAACVGQDPDWDPPPATDGAVDDDDADDASESDAATGEAADLVCEKDWSVCDGECRKTKDDPQACGLACTDCEAWLGEGAQCKDWRCEPADD